MAIESAARAGVPAGLRTAADRAFDALRVAIVEGELTPGAPLTEVEQATRLGVSRTPVREAFARLIAAGLATERGPRTLVVSEIEPDDVTALFELRTALDEQAARLAARRASTDESSARFAELAARFAAVDAASLSADDPQRHDYYALVAEFDAALDDSLSDSPYLASAIASTRVHLARVRRLARDDDDRLACSAAEHAAIARAIADGDPERAAAATRLHLHEALTSIHAHLPRSGDDQTKERP
ncbi:GntR family transcriptional regulator [Microcella humidisoli]|uniref:GntR family transcriptional regulator n=1 Tax=Microcella humidisoli TaxID=2963406 RepID=A0ABY5FU54_9MICO|nr:GntR family transcriptional regulator [Microcella humidisoli]UTT61654.1 GntR family transcriptional regulator [Microcella humidisoli]